MVKVLVKNINSNLEVKEIENNLESMQKIVGGYIECIYVYKDVYAVVNEEGLLMNLEYNCNFKNKEILGNMFFHRVNEDGEMINLTEEDINRLSALL